MSSVVESSAGIKILSPNDSNFREIGRHREADAGLDPNYARPHFRAAYAPADSETSPSSGVSLGALAQSLKKGAWKIGLLGLLGICLGVAVFVARPVVYPARTTIEILGLNENFMNFNLVDPQAGSGIYSATTANIQTQIRIIESTEIRRRVLARLRLGNLPAQDLNSGFIQRIRVKLGIVEAEPVAATRQALNMAILTTKAGIIRETHIIEVRCQSTSPEIASAYLNTLVAEYADHTIEVRSNTARRTSEWLSSQLRDARERMDQAEIKMREFERASGYTSPTPQDTLAASKLRQLRDELAGIQSDRIAKQTRWEMVKAVAPENVFDVVEDSTLRSKQAQILDLRRQVADLRTTLTPSHYRVQKLMAQLAEVEAEAKRDLRTILDRTRADYESALAKERHLQAAHNAQTRAFAAESGQAGQRSILQRERDMAQQTYNGLLQQSTQAGMVAAVPSTQVRPIEAAEPITISLGLGLIPMVVVGLLVGSILGSAFLVTREFMNRTVRSSQSAMELLRVPELGVIPSASILRAPSWRPKQLSRRGSTQLELQAAQGDSDYLAKQTMFAESFRTVLASLLGNRGMPSEGRRSPAYVISSPGPAEGKTFVTANLGMAVAETGRRVLLVDMDLRRPGLTAFFKLKNQFGVGDIVLGTEFDPELGPKDELQRERLVDFTQQTTAPNLYLLSAGTVSGDKMPSILHHPRLRQLIGRLGEEFDFILIDTAPVGLFADARVLGRLSDGVILVLRADRTTRDSVIETRRRMEDDGTPLIGTILNDTQVAEVPSYYLYHPGSRESGTDRKS